MLIAQLQTFIQRKVIPSPRYTFNLRLKMYNILVIELISNRTNMVKISGFCLNLFNLLVFDSLNNLNNNK